MAQDFLVASHSGARIIRLDTNHFVLQSERSCKFPMVPKNRGPCVPGQSRWPHSPRGWAWMLKHPQEL
jgi:hypothetical protein